MFQISADQTQWFHLYRVQELFPITFVLFACDETNEQGSSARLLDLRILSTDQIITGGSWCVRSDNGHGKQATRADCTKFLELQAKFSIANTSRKGIDKVELIESSREELALVASLDDNFRNNLEAVAPTLFSKLARNLFSEISVNQTGLEFEELPDWPTRNVNLVS